MNYNSPSSEYRRHAWGRSALLVAGAFLLGGLILPNLRWQPPPSDAQPGASLGVKPAPPAKTLSEAEVYARAAQVAYQSVVNIDTTERVRVRRGFFDELFSDSPQIQERSNAGSGVIISPDGYILTNEHVVGQNGNGKRILVTLTDGRKFPARIIGADRITDVALMKVETSNLPAAQIGTAKGLVPGQMSVAIGNPLGLRFTVTNGVVSALQRPITTPDGRIYPDLIQHSALINPGNSGGPLVNLQGQVIGINTLVNANAQGIGFAIPIDTALRVADELKRFGKIKRPWLGLVVSTNNDYFVGRYGVAEVEGAVVRGIYPNGPAFERGIQPGDVIVELDGKPVRTEDDLKAIERGLKIGQRVKVLLQRGDQRGSGQITVGEAP
jgi:S1-C subfamily serine protease